MILKSTPLFFFAVATHAESALSFKQETSPTIHWFSYLLVFSVLCIGLILVARKTKLTPKQAKCQVIETLSIHHKTKAYVVDYQGLRFLIADNQNALAIHPLPPESQVEKN